MNKETETTQPVAHLVGQLASVDAVTREKSRKQLVQRGGPDVTRAMVLTLIDPQPHVRWEAAKTLQAIADPVAAPALMHALDDEDEDVRWVAAEALIALGKTGLLTVLSGLTKRAASVAFRKSAHHVLHELKDLGGEVAAVLQSLERAEAAVTAPPAAYQALVALMDKSSANRVS